MSVLYNSGPLDEGALCYHSMRDLSTLFLKRLETAYSPARTRDFRRRLWAEFACARRGAKHAASMARPVAPGEPTRDPRSRRNGDGPGARRCRLHWKREWGAFLDRGLLAATHMRWAPARKQPQKARFAPAMPLWITCVNHPKLGERRTRPETMLIAFAAPRQGRIERNNRITHHVTH